VIEAGKRPDDIGSSLPPHGCDALDNALVAPTAAVEAASLEVLIASATVGNEDTAVAAIIGVAMAVANGGSPSHVVVAEPTF